MVQINGSSGARSGVVVVGTLCLFALLLFSIAFVVVIALIPIYLSNRTSGQQQATVSPVQRAIYAIPPDTVFAIGPLTQGQLAYLVEQLQAILNRDSITAGSVIISPSGSVSSLSSTKRRAAEEPQVLSFGYRIRNRLQFERVEDDDILSRANLLIRIYVIDFDHLLHLSGSDYSSTSVASSSSTSTSAGGSITTGGVVVASSTTGGAQTTSAAAGGVVVASPTSGGAQTTSSTVGSAETTSSTVGSAQTTSSTVGGAETTSATAGGVVVTSPTTTVEGVAIPGYAPVGAACPNGPFITSSSALYPAEASYIAQRAPKADSALRAWLSGIALSPTDYNENTSLPRVALATSGGGYRSLLTGAGVIQAFDGREQNIKTPFSGLLQGLTYQTGTSGGGWLLTSFAVNNYPTISVLRDTLWIQRFQYFLILPNPVQPLYLVDVAKEIVSKKEAGYNVSVADVWGRLLAFQLINASDGGVNVTFDDITSTDEFVSYNIPFPIITTDLLDPGECQPPLTASIFEFTPYAFGSWDAGIQAFTPIKYLGTIYNNGQIPANGQCMEGFDNAGFVLGTSSFLFNVIECTIINDTVGNLDPTNTTDVIVNEINTYFEREINNGSAIVADEAISARYPNPFQGSAQSPKIASRSELNFVDGGESDQNIPLWPLIQLVRLVDIIIANDNSADTTTNFPDGSELLTTYTEAMRVGLPFPFIPDVSVFLSQGLNIRPTFFGCNQTNVPLIIYIPNTNISFASGIETFKPTYSEEETRGLIENGVNVATRSNSTEWARCVACAIARRREGLFSSVTSIECLNCFNQYCY